MILKKEYFSKSAIELAPDLLGKIICRKTDKGVTRARITETECYYGESDTACHAHKGRTERTKVMYEAGGITYVYLCYGMHAMLNIVTGSVDHPEAVLIRGVEGAIGPGRTTKLLSITTVQNAIPLEAENEIWIEDDGARPEYTALPRVGIDYADDVDRKRLWRFLVK